MSLSKKELIKKIVKCNWHPTLHFLNELKESGTKKKPRTQELLGISGRKSQSHLNALRKHKLVKTIKSKKTGVRLHKEKNGETKTLWNVYRKDEKAELIYEIEKISSVLRGVEGKYPDFYEQLLIPKGHEFTTADIKIKYDKTNLLYETVDKLKQNVESLKELKEEVQEISYIESFWQANKFRISTFGEIVLEDTNTKPDIRTNLVVPLFKNLNFASMKPQEITDFIDLLSMKIKKEDARLFDELAEEIRKEMDRTKNIDQVRDIINNRRNDKINQIVDKLKED